MSAGTSNAQENVLDMLQASERNVLQVLGGNDVIWQNSLFPSG
jgi:hypothetical protein